MKMRKISLCAAMLAVALLPGCFGYRVGSMLPPDLKTVYIPTFANKTTEPLLEADVTRSVIQEFQKDGSLKVGKQGETDTILEATITDYQLKAVSYRNNQATRTEEYRLILTASIALKRVSDGKVIAENPRVQGEYVFVMDGDLTSSKAQGIPLAAQDLAHKVVQSVVEAW